MLAGRYRERRTLQRMLTFTEDAERSKNGARALAATEDAGSCTGPGRPYGAPVSHYDDSTESDIKQA